MYYKIVWCIFYPVSGLAMEGINTIARPDIASAVSTIVDSFVLLNLYW